MKKVMALLLVAYATQAVAKAYLQRFGSLPARHNAVAYDAARVVLNKVQGAVLRYPWLKRLEQPRAVVEHGHILHRFAEQFRMEWLPHEFHSRERTVLTYADGTEVRHLEVAESTPNYEQFERRGRRYDTPAIVSVRDHNGVVRGEHIYTERGINYLHQVFSESGFRFEKFLDSVESPLINVAAGGYHFAWLLSKLNLDRQENLPRGQRRKYIDVFSLDRSGAYRTFTTNPWYLFGDLYATGLPDDTFGAVITLGGPLNRVTLPRFEYIAALRELGRIAAPRGRLLIEYSIPTGKMLAVLEESGLNYLNFLTYESREHPRWKSSRRSQLIDISLAEDSTLP